MRDREVGEVRGSEGKLGDSKRWKVRGRMGGEGMDGIERRKNGGEEVG